MSEPQARLAAALADRYRIERQLGQGGMATVYLAEDLRHERKVAIKVLKPELSAIIGAERFLREIKTIANLQHPHILGLIDSGEVSGTAYYVMPFVEGESLRDRLTREKQLPVSAAVRFATEVATALDYAHRHGVIHRDIKPENILLHDGTALVADFGIALAASRTGGSRMTETGMSLGTPQYMSPEQASGDRNIDGRTDVYSLGCVLYEMLVGEPPFTGPNPQAIVARVLTEPVPSIRARRETVPEGIELAVLKAVQKLPADRFESPGTFAEALRRDTDAPAGRRTTGPRIRSNTTRSSRGSLLLAAAFAAGTLLTYVATRLTVRASSAPTYVASRLGGPAVALIPRVSPDGKTVAFAAMEALQLQVGVLNPESGDWKTLTHDTTQGLAQGLAWSADGSRIYYERFLEVPRGVYSISRLGGDNRLILANAAGPVPLPDGSLLAWAAVYGLRFRMIRFNPDSGTVDSLPAYTRLDANGHMGELTPNGKEVVFLGGQSPYAERDTFFIMTLATRRIRILSALSAAQGLVAGSFTVTPDGRSVLVASNVGDGYRIIAVPMDGSGRQSVLMTTTAHINTLSIGADGSIYLDQMTRQSELARFDPEAGDVDPVRLPMSLSVGGQAWPLADGRTLMIERSGVGDRVMALAAGRDPAPFVSRRGWSSTPLAFLGPERMLVHVGDSSGVTGFVIVRSADGSVERQLPNLYSSSVAGSPDGKTIFYADSGAIWARSVEDGTRRRVADGSSVAVDPQGRYLVTLVSRADSVRLMHVPLDGGSAYQIRIHSPLRLGATTGLTPNAVGRDGRILVTVGSPGSFFFPAAILDPTTGSLKVLPPGFSYDVPFPGWDADGRVVLVAVPVQSSLWRFRPERVK